MSQTSSIDNKRIAKNTLILYVRMFFGMAVAFYTSRVILNTLGAEDFGLQNVVGGVIGMLHILVGALTSSTQRYLTFGLGKGEIERLKEIFMTSWFIHLFLAIIALIIAETIGLWFVREKLVIPSDRMHAAGVVYHLAIVSMVMSIIFTPYNASIIAHERMTAFAFFYIVGLIFKLIIVFLLIQAPWDKLITYSWLNLGAGVIMTAAQIIYCNYHFVETRWRKLYDKALAKKMGSFASWNLLGSLVILFQTQGLSILLNLFFGPLINAARAVAVQVQAAVVQFSDNFQTALTPQITKTYAQGELHAMHTLIERCSRFSFLLIYILALPVYFETPRLLEIWLGSVPEHTVSFVRLMIVTITIDAMAKPLMQAASATGEIRRYSLYLSCLMLLTFPLSYLALKLGGSPETVFIIHLLITFLAFFLRLYLIRPMIQFSVRAYLASLLPPMAIVVLASLPLPVIVYLFAPESLLGTLMVSGTAFLSASVASYFCGMTSHERGIVRQTVWAKLHLNTTTSQNSSIEESNRKVDDIK